jgi:23S rRNA pseudouridine1911/1915/1917 synthase
MKYGEKQIELVVLDKSANKRLDIFLSEELGISRSQAQKIIRNEQITINDKQPKKTGDRVKKNNLIKYLPFNKKTNKKLSLNNETIEQSSNVPKSVKSKQKTVDNKIEIISENKDFLVVNKPAGVLTHPTPNASVTNEALSDILVKKYPEIKKVGDNKKLRPGIVHRLDKEASGLLVVARTQKMFNHLKLQFKNREVKKEYLVLVHGKVNKDCDIINFPIARTKNSDKMASIPQTKYGRSHDEGKEAMTEFDVEKRFANSTLLRVKIHTGRTHQIRVHLLAYNHPVVGDPLYFQKKQRRKFEEKCGRLFLHCVKLGFVELDEKKQIFEVNLPERLVNFLNTLN